MKKCACLNLFEYFIIAVYSERKDHWVGKFELTLEGGIQFEGYSSSLKQMKYEEIFMAWGKVREQKMKHTQWLVLRNRLD